MRSSMLSRSPWFRALWPPLFGLLLALLWTWTYFGGIAPNSWSSTSQVRDWVWAQGQAQTTRSSLRDYHQWPYWDPWRCGGQDHLSHPDVDLWSPWGLVEVFVGVNPALRLKVYFHLMLAFWAMWLWLSARRYKLQPLAFWPRLIGASLFALSGFFAVRIAWGPPNLLAAAFVPLLMWQYERGRERIMANIWLGLLLAFMVLEGALLAAQMAWIMLILRMFYDLRYPLIKRTQTVLHALIWTTTALALSAVKLWPLILAWPHQTAVQGKREGLVLTQLLQIFLSRQNGHWSPGFTFERFEYFNYLGPLVLLAILWLLWRFRLEPFRELASILVLMTFFLLLGDQGPWFPYHWLQTWSWLRPALRVPARWSAFMAPWLVLLAVYMLHSWYLAWERRGWPLRWRQLLFFLLFILLLSDQIQVSWNLWSAQPFRQDPAIEQLAALSMQRRDVGESYRMQRKGQGNLKCVSLLGHKSAPGLKPLQGAQLWLQNPKAGRFRLLDWTPNRWRISYVLQEPARLFINQNFAPGWRLEGTGKIKLGQQRGQMLIELPAAAGECTLIYRTPGIVPGAMVSLLAFALLVLLAFVVLWRARRVLQ